MSKMPDLSNIIHPIQNGVINYKDDFEFMISETISRELRIPAEEYSFFLIERTMNPYDNSEYLAQLLFETFDVKSMYVERHGQCPLYASGRTTGIVLDSGDVNTVVAFNEGVRMFNSSQRLNFGGKEITKHLERLLAHTEGHLSPTPSDRYNIQSMKEKLAYCALDYENELATAGSTNSNFEKSFELLGPFFLFLM